jgi:hypothetical protein
MGHYGAGTPIPAVCTFGYVVWEHDPLVPYRCYGWSRTNIIPVGPGIALGQLSYVAMSIMELEGAPASVIGEASCRCRRRRPVRRFPGRTHSGGASCAVLGRVLSCQLPLVRTFGSRGGVLVQSPVRTRSWVSRPAASSAALIRPPCARALSPGVSSVARCLPANVLSSRLATLVGGSS